MATIKKPVKKAQTGTSLGMKSVKAGIDKNPNVTRADIIAAGTKQAKSGTKMTKAKDGKWIQKAINPAHKGYCTPETKATCTPRRKALAHTLRKIAKKK